MLKRKERQNERLFYEKTLEYQNAKRRDLSQKITKNTRGKMQPMKWYVGGAAAAVFLIACLLAYCIQMLALSFHNSIQHKEDGFFTPIIPAGAWVFYWLLLTPGCGAYLMHKAWATWKNNNARYDTSDMEEYKNDAYIQTLDHMFAKYEIAPDAGLGFDGHVSSLMGHAMISNKGIKNIEMPQFDGTVDGFVQKDAEGNVVKKSQPMFNKRFGEELFEASQVAKEFQTFYDATEYSYNPYRGSKAGGVLKDTAGKLTATIKRKTTKEDEEESEPKQAVREHPRRKPYDTVADMINGEFYPLDTETERPAGVYFYDKESANTILLAMTRGGKGQTYIEPAFDVWTREKNKWNIFTTDPKGELLAKFYYPATIRGFEIIQFNLLNPNLTNIYNPLANAIQEFRRNNAVKGVAYIDAIVETLFPDNGEIWNPAAGNMFRRAVYLLFDYYIEQEKYIRYVGTRDGIAQSITDQRVNELYTKITVYNVYVLIGELAAKVSKDQNFINIDPDAPNVTEKDLLTLLFDAMKMLPTNTLRSLALTANNAIAQIQSAQQTIAGIYATLLTGLSVYADPTAIALMSGGLDESLDVAGLGFPRRFGVQFSDDFVKNYRITGQLAKWSFYKDAAFTEPYESTKKGEYVHEELISTSNWAWFFFEGMIEGDIAYVKMDITAEDGTIATSFHFKFKKGYKLYDNITYVIDPITNEKIIQGGVLSEIVPGTAEETTSMYNVKRINFATKSYEDMEEPIIVSTQVYYSERPKFIFAVTPPHLQVYQKHILVMIDQIVNEQLQNSYSTKETRKPIVGTRFMMEEFGNIRSGDKGIPGIDTKVSIGLGQDCQFTFVLQSFQQLSAVYGEDIEKVIRANSANTIFLKSNDDALVNDLVRLSGVRHEIRDKSKSVSHKVGDIITTAEPVVNYTSEHNETTALTSNDLLFLAGRSPGNSITFPQGEMAIVGKLSTITPMAYVLHRHLPQPKTGQYSDTTLPTTKTGDSGNFLNNTINGEALVRERVAHAKIAQEVKATFLEVAKKNNRTINEADGELSSLMMNTVYEQYERDKGVTHAPGYGTSMNYSVVAETIKANLRKMGDKSVEQNEQLIAAGVIKDFLSKLLRDSNDTIKELVNIYKEKTQDSALGFDSVYVARFAKKLGDAFPPEEDLELDERDVFQDAERTASATGYTKPADPNAVNGLFSMLDVAYTSALESMVEEVLDNVRRSIPGVTMQPVTGETSTAVLSGGVMLMTAEIVNDDYFSPNWKIEGAVGSKEYRESRDKIEKAINDNPQLLNAIKAFVDELRDI